MGSKGTRGALDVAGPARVLAFSMLALAACRSDGGSERPNVASTSRAAKTPTPVSVELPRPLTPATPGCTAVEAWADGRRIGTVCESDAPRLGLTVVDLSDDWTPRVFAPDPETHDAPEYRAKYLELARAGSADLGLYGIAPTIGVLAARLTDEKTLACRKAIDRRPIAELDEAVKAAPDDKARARVVSDPSARDAIRAIEADLACSGLLPKTAVTGALGGSTQVALDALRRRHMVVAGPSLDLGTLDVVALGGDELDFRGLLRGLRERVADAAGLIEDGSASNEKVLVARRELDLSRFDLDREAIADGAGDLVDAATDAAASALGWTSPDAARAFLAERGKDGVRTLRVAVELPPRPSYHADAMDLRVEIDRGDVFYEMPGLAAAERKKQGTFRRPSFVVYAKDGDHERALIRWATTIGGWKKERLDDGSISLKYKESDVGDRFWRRIVAAPAWMPPDSTPETDLVHQSKDGEVTLKRDLIQPGFRNAYGLVMLIHDEAVEKGGVTTWVDHGIRTHGSVDYKSIKRGESHGCHRLYNQLALRLSGFLLEHRKNVRKGKMAAGYHRTLEVDGETVEVDVPTRGYLYELDPPVPVRVLQGNVLGEAKKAVSTAIPIKSDEPKKG